MFGAFNHYLSKVINCHIYNNNAERGAGISLFYDTEALIDSTEIYNNTAIIYGGIYNAYANPMIKYSNIHSNFAYKKWWKNLMTSNYIQFINTQIEF